MDAPPSENTSAAPIFARTGKRWLWIAFASSCLAVLAALVLSTRPEPSAVWGDYLSQPPRLEQLIEGIARHLRVLRNRVVLLDSEALKTSSAAEVTNGLAAPILSTNCFSAWILPPKSLQILDEHFRTSPQIYDSRMDVVPSGGVFRAAPTTNGNTVFPNFFVLTRYSHGLAKLQVTAHVDRFVTYKLYWPKLPPASNAHPPGELTLLTNFNGICHADLPVGYGLLIGGDAMTASNASGQLEYHWALISPQSVR